MIDHRYTCRHRPKHTTYPNSLFWLCTRKRNEPEHQKFRILYSLTEVKQPVSEGTRILKDTQSNVTNVVHEIIWKHVKLRTVQRLLHILMLRYKQIECEGAQTAKWPLDNGQNAIKVHLVNWYCIVVAVGILNRDFVHFKNNDHMWWADANLDENVTDLKRTQEAELVCHLLVSHNRMLY